MRFYRYYLSVGLFIICNHVFGQTFTMISSSDSTGIPYANVVFYINDTIVGGTYTNTHGEFSLSNGATTKIKVSHVAYNDTTLVLNSKFIHKVIYLHKINYNLKEITIFDKFNPNTSTIYKGKKIENRGIFKSLFSNKNNMITWRLNCGGYLKGIEVLRLQSGLPKEKYIKSFVFYSEVLNKDFNYIVKPVFYENSNGIPNKKLPYEIVMELTPKHKKRIDIDVSNEGIILPPEGLFIGLEWVGCPIDYERNTSEKAKYESDNFKGVRLLHFYLESEKNEERVFWRFPLKDNNDVFRKGEIDGNTGLMEVPIFGLEVYQ